MNQTTPQRTLNWYRERLGKITGSRLGDIMKSGRAKADIFSDTAKSYLYQLAAERNMNRRWLEDDDRFAQYIDFATVTSKAIEWGIEMEAQAIKEFERFTGRIVHPAYSTPLDGFPYFASSPDGMSQDGPIEVKCPNQNTFMRYVYEINDGESLKKVKPEYYYQCLAHMMCTNSQQCIFITYCLWQDNPLHIVQIDYNEADAQLAKERIALAESFIQKVINYE